MFSSDAHDILGAAAERKAPPPPAKKQEVKRPDGMARELYNLLVHQGKEDKIHSILPSHSKRGYTNLKAQVTSLFICPSTHLLQLGLRRVRKWTQRPFVNPARKDSLQLVHWERESTDANAPAAVYPFARYNKTMPLVTFTDQEYNDFLQDQQWSKEETIHLLELAQRFDLRWPVIESRFDRDRFNKGRKSMEDMKERYYNLVNQLNSARSTYTEPLCYDADHERRRKEQLSMLLSRTDEEIKEEEELKEALRRINQKRKEREKKARDLQLLLNQADRQSLSPDISGGGSVNAAGSSGTPSGAQASGASSATRQRRPPKGQTSSAGTAADQLLLNETAAASQVMPSIRFYEFSSAGPHFRSQEMKLPPNIRRKKMENIDSIEQKLKLERDPCRSPHRPAGCQRTKRGGW